MTFYPKQAYGEWRIAFTEEGVEHIIDNVWFNSEQEVIEYIDELKMNE